MLVLLWLVPCLAQPDTLWTRDYRNCGGDFTMTRTSDGGYAVGSTGESERFEEGDGGDFMIVKLDSLANLEWRQFYTVRQPIADCGFTAVQLQDGGYAVTGYSSGNFVAVRTGRFQFRLLRRAINESRIYMT